MHRHTCQGSSSYQHSKKNTLAVSGCKVQVASLFPIGDDLPLESWGSQQTGVVDVVRLRQSHNLLWDGRFHGNGSRGSPPCLSGWRCIPDAGRHPECSMALMNLPGCVETLHHTGATPSLQILWLLEQSAACRPACRQPALGVPGQQ